MKSLKLTRGSSSLSSDLPQSIARQTAPLLDFIPRMRATILLASGRLTLAHLYFASVRMQKFGTWRKNICTMKYFWQKEKCFLLVTTKREFQIVLFE